MIVNTDKENEYAALWKWTVDSLLKRGCSADDAIQGANLVLDAYKLQRVQQAKKAEPVREDQKRPSLRRTGT